MTQPDRSRPRPTAVARPWRAGIGARLAASAHTARCPSEPRRGGRGPGQCTSRGRPEGRTRCAAWSGRGSGQDTRTLQRAERVDRHGQRRCREQEGAAIHHRVLGPGVNASTPRAADSYERWGGLAAPRLPAQQSNTDQQMSFRNRWSSSTSSRIASGSWSRCHRHSRRPAASLSSSGAAARTALMA